MDNNDVKILKCSFCGKTEGQVEQLISGPNGVYICSDCVELCNEILDMRQDLVFNPDVDDEDDEIEYDITLYTPEEIKARLDEHIIGQDAAKKTLAVAVYNHYKRIDAIKLEEQDDIVLEKSNVLLLGPTGCGKTLLAKTLAGILNVPFAVADATTLTEAGYVGEDVENILLKLIKAADYDIKRAEMGIVYIDEIDKIARKSENVSITRDVSGEGVQQALLKIIESTVASVPPQGGRKHPNQECISIDTTNILFICGGAFVGLDKIIEKRKDGSSLGFGGEVHSRDGEDRDRAFTDVQPNDLIKFGMIPELVGRIPVTVSLHGLDEDMLVRILTEPKNSLIKQYKKLLKYDNVELEFTDDALRAIARKAISLKTGARGLKSIIESTMTDLMYCVPSDKSIVKVVIEADCIDKGEAPELIREAS